MDLASLYFGNIYKALFVIDSSSGIDATLRDVTDGGDTNLPFQLSTSKQLFTGTNILGFGVNTSALGTDSSGILAIQTSSNNDIDVTTGTGKTLFNNDVEIDGSMYFDGLIKSNNASIRMSDLTDFGNGIKVDTLDESTTGAGITIDGVLIKDNDVEADEVRTDSILEKTVSNGVEIDGLKIKDSILYTDNITDNGAASITIDVPVEMSSDLDVTGALSSSGITNTGAISATTTITSVGNIITSGAIQTDSIIEKTSANGVSIDSVLLKDDSIACNDGYFDTLNDDGAGFITFNDAIKVDSISKVGSNVTVENVVFNGGAVSSITTIATTGQATLASTASQVDFSSGAVDPNGVVSGKIGDAYFDSGSNRMYFNTSGGTSWRYTALT